MTAKFGKPDIDLFASRANFKVKKYISYYPDPDATGVDAFLTSWRDLQFYAFPLSAIISKVISKIVNEKAEGILVVAVFTNQIWFLQVMRPLIDYPLLLPDTNKSLFFPCRMKKTPVFPAMKLMACHVSGTLSKGLDFQKKLQTYSCSRGALVFVFVHSTPFTVKVVLTKLTCSTRAHQWFERVSSPATSDRGNASYSRRVCGSVRSLMSRRRSGGCR